MTQTISPFEVYLRVRPLSERETNMPGAKSSKIVTTSCQKLSTEL